MNLLTFQIRMKTAQDLKRLIEGFSSDASADNKKWLVVHIRINGY